MSKQKMTGLALLLLSFRVSAQQSVPAAYLNTTRFNYIRLWTATYPDASASDLVTRPLSDVKQYTQYTDGFGRSVESVLKTASPNGFDVVTANLYDGTNGNEVYQYLPFSAANAPAGDNTSDGNFKLDPFQEQVPFYNTYLANQVGETASPSSSPNWAYSMTNYEAGPGKRVLGTFAPGVNWVGSAGQPQGPNQHGQQVAHWVNTSVDAVPIWTIGAWSLSNPQTNIIPAWSGTYYGAGALHKTVTTDEQGNQTIEFIDSYGQVILKKVQYQPPTPPATQLDNGSGSWYTGWLSTFYVYDDHGQLRFIITPDAVAILTGNGWSLTQTTADALCYRFEYDQQGRMIIKKTPGTPTGAAGEIWMVYDQLNRKVMEQDGNMRSPSVMKWHYTQYDDLDRPVSDGLITDPTNYTNLSYHVSNAEASGNNSSGVSAWPVLTNYTNEVLSGLFYDNYTNTPGGLPQTIDQTTTNGTANSAFTTNYTTAPYPQPLTQSNMTQGLATGSLLEVQGTNGASTIPTVNFYDEKGRVIQSQTKNITGGTDITTTQYSWSGQVVSSLVAHNYTSTVNPQSHWLSSAMTYDNMGRLKTVTKKITSTINGQPLASQWTNPATMLSCTYDELGRVSVKSLGPLESQTYVYNVRGWLLGINPNYISTGMTGNYFGLELAYDKSGSNAPGNSYTTPAFNGNIAGSTWKSAGDGINRKYDYTYDPDSRILSASFHQNTTNNTWDQALDFSVSGAGTNNTITYDANGNVASLNANGVAENGNTQIDQLVYTYVNGPGSSNQLSYVTDVSNVPNSTLGDFHYPSGQKPPSDYTYDADGNTISDYNRSVSNISYWSYPNLPHVFTMPKGTITYTYDGKGNKLKKVVQENGVTIPTIIVNNAILTNVPTNITTTTNYIGDFEYKTVNYSSASLTPLNNSNTDVLQFVRAGEGRIRFIPATGAGAPGSMVHDWLLRDHQQSVRVGITDESQQDPYPAATGETTQVTVGGSTNSAQNYEALYYNFNTNDFISTTSLPSWYSTMLTTYGNILNQQPGGTPANNDPYSQTATQSQKVFQTCGNTATNPTGDYYGLAITLKVMAGDVINVYGTSFWHNTGNLSGSGYLVQNVVTSLLNAFAGSPAVMSSAHSLFDGMALNTASNGPAALALAQPGMLSTATTMNGGTAPYAGISYILFNDQLQPTTVGMDPVVGAPDQQKNHNFAVPVLKDGYVMIFVSNQSPLNVYFDNLQVIHNRGHLLEEAHYYPTGLLMAGISDRAWNKQPNFRHYQGKEMQNQEWYDGTGLEEHDFGSRFYDQQLGRWNTQDPAGQFSSPYLALGDNFVKDRDPNGQLAGADDMAIFGIGFVTGFVEEAIATHWNFKNGNLIRDLVSGLVTASVAEVGYLSLGGGISASQTVDMAPALQMLPGAAGMSASTLSSAAASWAFTSVELPYTAAFVAASAYTYVTNSQNIQAASPDLQVALVSGFNATSAITAGFNSTYMQNSIDGILGIGNKSLIAGAVSQGIGGALSNAGNSLITNGGHWDKNVTFSAAAGFGSSFAGQVGHNAVGGLPIPGKATQAAAQNITSGVVQQWVGNIANEIGWKNGFYGVGNPDAGAYITGNNWWASYVNGMGGFDSDMMQP